ncbi:MAG: serine hydrolase [Cyclobacteriaceae bacterium]|nr:serine hydrolase [Cyclobacteriaceae bacterium]
MKNIRFILIIVLCFMSCGEKRGLIESLMRDSGKFGQILHDPGKYKLQIIYTQIDRNPDNTPTFITHRFRVNPREYFYPASTVKLPMAALALEKINQLSIPGLTATADMVIDSVFDWQHKVTGDTTSANGKASIAHSIRKILFVSDNEAFNMLYEFVGQAEANQSLHDKGYKNTLITHRLSIPLTLDQNRITARVRFFKNDTLVYSQEATENSVRLSGETPKLIGKGYYQGDALVQQPMDFRDKNELGLEDFHNMLKAILFPEAVDQTQRFQLTHDDYRLLYRGMYQFPKESGIAAYDHYDDAYCKFFMYGGSGAADATIRVLNKVGEAYGFLIDMAYIVDFDKKIEFILGAVIYVNEDEILNDDNYDYERVGFPFFKDLGRVFYEYEMNRTRKNIPDLSTFKPEP